MENKNVNIFRYTAGGLFIISALYGVIRNFINWGTFSFSFVTLMVWIACALMAIAMFTKKYKLLAVGAGIRLIPAVRSLISYFSMIEDFYYDWVYIGYVLNGVLILAGYVLLLFAALKREKAKALGTTAALLNLAGLIVSALPFSFDLGIRGGFQIITNNLLYTFLVAAAIAMSGYVMQIAKPKANKVSPQASIPVVDTTSNIEKITKLKELLDAGSITQEEFDAKKKELLNL